MEIQLNKQMNVKIHASTFQYIGRKVAQIPTGEFWSARGLSGHSRNVNKNMELQKQCIAAINTQDGQTQLKAFLDDTVKVFDLLTHPDRSHLEKFLGNRTFIFISGIMRSGGSYLLSEVSKIHGIDVEELDLGMIHDRIPSYDHFYYNFQSAQMMCLLFDLAQFLAWVNREMPGKKVIVKKHQTLSFAIPVIEHIFKEKAVYIKTIRHPLTSARSAALLDNINLETTQWPSFYSNWENMLLPLCGNPWDEMTFYEKFLIYYEKLYTDFAKNTPGLTGNVFSISFGEQFERFLKEYAENIVEGYCPGKFNAALKNESGQEHKKAEKTLNNVIKQWELMDLEFPATQLR